MKKFILVMFLAALAASIVSAQVVLGGDNVSQKSTGNVVDTNSNASPSVDLSTHVWFDNHIESYVQNEGPTEAASSDADVDPSVVATLKGEMGAVTRIGSLFYLKAQSFYDINRSGFVSATVIGGPGFAVGPVKFGVNIGTSLTDLKGIKLGADVGWDINSNISMFAWGNTLIGLGAKNSVVKLTGNWIRGAQDYKSWDVGMGVDCFAVDGLYFGAIASMYGNNNRWETVKDVLAKDVQVTTVDLTAKVGVVQDGRLLYLGIGWVSGRAVIDGDPSKELKLLVGVKFQ